MKKLRFLPHNTLITLALVLAADIVLMLLTLDYDGPLSFLLLMLLPLPSVLICEIIGIILREKLHKRYADNIAVLIVNLINIPILILYIITDMNSNGFLAGLGGTLALCFMMPVCVASLIINLIFFLIKRSKTKKEAAFGAQAE